MHDDRRTSPFPPLLVVLAPLSACGSAPAPEVPFDTTAIVAELAARATHLDCRGDLTCALDATGRLRCWGGDGALRGGLDGPARALAVGDAHACVLDEAGQVRCIGTDAPAEGRFLTIEAAGDLTCGIRDDLGVACWGGTWSYLRKAPDGRFRDLALADGRTCATALDGTSKCWGEDLDGHLSSAAAPATRLPADPGVESVDCGHGTCRRGADGAVACSGGPYAGQAHAPEGRYTAIASGSAHSCALAADGAVACWGANDAGQSTPPAGKFASLALGGNLSCALDAKGAATCWGDPLADGPDATLRARALALGEGLGCAITRSGGVHCFGADATNVDFLLEIVHDVSEAYVRREAIDLRLADGTWRCYRRQTLQSGSVTGTSWVTAPAITCEPFAPTAPDAVMRAVAAKHTCLVDGAGAVACQGPNGFGQTQAPPGTYRAVAPGDHHACALTVEGTIACWGSYGDGVPL